MTADDPAYDWEADAIGSYYAAIAAKKARGDRHDWDKRPPLTLREGEPYKGKRPAARTARALKIVE